MVFRNARRVCDVWRKLPQHDVRQLDVGPIGSGVGLWVEVLESRQLLAGLPTLIDIVAGAGGSNPKEFTNVNNVVFFNAFDATNGFELWKSDGTAAGTVLVEDIRPGLSSSGPGQLTNVNGTLFLLANDGTNGHEL